MGARVILLEKTNRIGTKILVSGGGKCNLAHDGPLEEVIRAFRPEEGRFIRPACYRLRNDQVISHFTSRGLKVYTREDGRVFPIDATAKDVVAILRDDLEAAGVEVRLETPVSRVLAEDGRVVGVCVRQGQAKTIRSDAEHVGYRPATAKNLLREIGATGVSVQGEEREIRADAVVICPGGSSYPNSGTTGDGFQWARDLGHSVRRVHAALAPIYLESGPWQELSGVSLREVVLKGRAKKEVARWTGDLLFTHQGVSGPCALGISREVEEAREMGEVRLEVDLWPESTFESAGAEILRESNEFPHRRLATYLTTLIPERVVEAVLASAGVPAEITLGRLERKARNRLVETLKGWPLGIVSHVPLEKGEVVAGGIALEEVDPQTMASKLVPGLFLAGEVLNIAGPVGGYNLQAAFATGYVAGESAAKKL